MNKEMVIHQKINMAPGLAGSLRDELEDARPKLLRPPLPGERKPYSCGTGSVLASLCLLGFGLSGLALFLTVKGHQPGSAPYNH